MTISQLKAMVLHHVLHPGLGGRRLITTILRRLDRGARLQRLKRVRAVRAMRWQVHWISPQDVVFVSREAFSMEARTQGSVKDGDWDLLEERFEDLDFVVAARSVFEAKMLWADTAFYKRVIAEIDRGVTKWGCNTQAAFDARLIDLATMYEEMGDLGFIPNHSGDQITVNVGRHGDLLFNDGRHRLAFARILRIPQIAVSVHVRHRAWVELTNEIVDYAMQQRGKLYAPLLHPDLGWIPSHHGHKRFEIMRPHLRGDGGRVLDIGCHWGYFCHQLEMLGFECVGVESSGGDFAFLRRLKRASNRRFQIHNQSIFDFADDQSCEFDIVLALAIFHHFIKSPELLVQLERLLERLRCQEMFFAPALPDEPQMQTSYWNPTPQEFVSFIQERTGLTRAKVIGHAEDRRPVYWLRR